jgi:hypothetical protein
MAMALAYAEVEGPTHSALGVLDIDAMDDTSFGPSLRQVERREAPLRLTCEPEEQPAKELFLSYPVIIWP